ncbi:hypothetical protein MMC18_000961 [Xylographa bjoerkii]|nr:hypothetical protein [Xylographa bjoerkii]
MRSKLLIISFLASALAVPHPQLIDLDGVAAAEPPVFVTVPLDVASNTPTLLATTTVAPITTDAPGTRKRSLGNKKRDGTCEPSPNGSGPVPSPDTASAFLADPDLQAMATNAATPYGYAQVFANLPASLSAANYMGLYTLTSYDPSQCQSRCDQVTGCLAFNIYIERDPSVDPNAAACPNPPSYSNYKCTLWGAPVSAAEATNAGQYRDSFQVVITASNGPSLPPTEQAPRLKTNPHRPAYNKNAPPPPIASYDGPVPLGGAINAPLDPAGADSYMGYQYFPFSQTQGFTPQTCADACGAQTAYNSQHPAADCSYEPCVRRPPSSLYFLSPPIPSLPFPSPPPISNPSFLIPPNMSHPPPTNDPQLFFNAYVLSLNGLPQGLYCALYNETWSPGYATNYGQYRGSDEYAVSDSYSYAVSVPVAQPAYDGACVAQQGA